MTNLPKALRAKLQEVATIGVLEVCCYGTRPEGLWKTHRISLRRDWTLECAMFQGGHRDNNRLGSVSAQVVIALVLCIGQLSHRVHRDRPKMACVDASFHFLEHGLC